MSYTLVMGSDHAGLQLKDHLVQWLQGQGYEVQDRGVHSHDSMDYPDIAAEVAQAVGSGQFKRGILVCGSGIGVAISANKIPGVRAARCHDPLSAALSRQHNDANILTLGERLITPTVAEQVLESWLKHDFEGGRHQRRVDKIKDLESPDA